MEQPIKKLSEISQFGYDLDFTEVFTHAFNVYKKIALYAGVVILAMIAVFAIIGMFIGAFVAGVGSFTNIMTGISLGVMSPIARVIYIAVAATISGLMTPLYAGIMQMAYKADRNVDFSIADGFEYYRSKYFLPLFVSAVLISIFTTIFSQIGQLLGIQFIVMAVVYLMILFTILSVPLIIFGNFNAIDSLKYSFVVVRKKFVIILGLVLVSIICAMVGFIAICIGIIFTIPFIFAMYYSIYIHSVGIDEKSEIDEIGVNNLENW